MSHSHRYPIQRILATRIRVARVVLSLAAVCVPLAMPLPYLKDGYRDYPLWRISRDLGLSFMNEVRSFRPVDLAALVIVLVYFAFLLLIVAGPFMTDFLARAYPIAAIWRVPAIFVAACVVIGTCVYLSILGTPAFGLGVWVLHGGVVLHAIGLCFIPRLEFRQEVVVSGEAR